MTPAADSMREAKRGINERKRQAVLTTIADMARDQDPALSNHSEIARRAGVGRNYVSKFAADIELAHADVNRRYLSGQHSRAALGAASMKADYETLKHHATGLERQVQALKKRLALQLGDEALEDEAGSRSLGPAIVTLKEERDGLAARVTELELQLHEMREELEASRRTTRRLMRERNTTTNA